MDYLEYVGVVHRDLAARNVLGKTLLTSMFVLLTVGPKCTLAASHAAQW